MAIIKKSLLYMILATCLIFSLMGCVTINTYPHNYKPSDWETSMGPPDWYLNESDGGWFETVNQ